MNRHDEMTHHHNEVERFRFFVLPNNVSGSVAIPLTLSPTPTTLASLTLRSDCRNTVLLSATVGWLAVTNGTGLARVDVLFRIWRGAPVTGALIFSADDSASSTADNSRVSSFSHVDTLLTRPFSYFLTAELPDAGSAATVIGPVTFTAIEFER
ncbi:Hypothetical protein LUCI_1976 [Lucifera butyrica]|uniref:Uncharacterized protein n=1 Tax=Lucifera butyrica TaxID=1351585 RepID=A0A498R744_9FIRM|nr:hypothetical protein [Lucifera butyrica]VBB06740.1 Hypothetical protein LUCI_1976 [Lucifera butyrica]